jgi:hypothetical protein
MASLEKSFHIAAHKVNIRCLNPHQKTAIRTVFIEN